MQQSAVHDIPFHQRPSCTLREACRATGLSRTTLYERMAVGDLKTITIGRRRLVNVPSLLKLVGAGPEIEQSHATARDEGLVPADKEGSQ
jgi:predicted DNA-binding transcriptional regulator AlpA